ncbi:MAG TPA: response regulator transcription factor [Candidatus Limivivens intestinipullorum]|uniref:Stage 0 sporulation protein A homolog n=1 Tax=Candidatus Limivivens intestinipullorum TaxID=2840858 RepID=A0A9D1EVC0_9FIRM|nr:response regulator transcription factor [Candidatus Limivivens intestinipullorum]
MTIWIVEDDAVILEGLTYSLTQEGYQVFTSGTVRDALVLLEQNTPFDFCLLDVMLPDGTGFEICRAIRARSQVPILFLTACSDEVNTVMALEQGADDYIAKPFHLRELLARMKAILRRTQGASGQTPSLIQVGENQINTQTAKVTRGGEEVVLTATEYRLLLVFLNHRGQNLSRQQILDCLWDEAGDFVNDNTLTVYIKRLRQKLGDTEENHLIKTIRGYGYRMDRQ